MLGTLLGNYRVVEQLGEGGMGVVYIGRHETLNRRVVVKLLQPELSRLADMVQRFFNEAQAATAIHNPGIVQVFDFGVAPDGRAYFVMELLEGQSLTARLKQRRLDAYECCRIARQIANVLQAAHAVGITHRDLKPDNLFLIPDPEVIGGERVKVLDFGLAKLASEAHAAGVRTRTGVLMGTPSYMSPEQCRSAVTADPRSDIYSLGCVLFEMACGRPPFVARGVGDLIGAHLLTPPPHPQSLEPNVPPALAQLIVHLLAKQPSARPQTMATVSQALDEIMQALGGPFPRASTPLPFPAQPPSYGQAPAPVQPPPYAHAPTPLPIPAQAPPYAHAPTPLPIPAQAPPYARAPTPLPIPAHPPPYGHSPMPFPVPQPSSPSTLSGSAGTSDAQPRVGRRRLSWVLGGIVLAIVAAAIAIAITTEDSASQEQPIGHDKAVATPHREDAAPIADASPDADADAAPAAVPPLAPLPTPTAADAAKEKEAR